MHQENNKLNQLKTMFESELWQHFFAKNLSDVIWIVDLDLNYIYLSPSAGELSGYSREELSNLTPAEILTPASMDKAKAIFGETLASKEAGPAVADRSRILEVEQVRKDGSTVWVELNVSFVREDSGKPLGLFGITRDIDARKKVEEALQTEQREKELILNNLAEQVAFLDSEYRIIWANSKVIERHNLYDVQFKGQKCYELYHQLDQPCPDCPVVEAFKTDKTCSGVHRSPDGIYWQVTGIPVHDQKGEIIGAMDTALNITDLITSRQELKESEAFARTIMDNLPLGLSVNSVAPEVRFTYMNDNFLNYYHTTREALSEPDAFWDVVYEDPEFRAKIKKRVEDDCASGDLDRMRWENVPLTKDGQVVAYINATNTPVPDKNFMISTVWDVTDRFRAEDAIRTLNSELEQRVRERTVELEAVNKELESFAYSISHDFRAPLRALDGFSASLTEKYGNQLDEQGLHYLSRIRNAAIYMSNLVDDLLKLSRVTRADIKKEQVNLSKLAAEVVASLQEIEPDRKVEILITADLTAKGDPHLLQNALQNLLGNAWKFSSQEKQAKIEVERTTVEGEQVFFVRDNGVGFNMAYSDKLFGAFQRLHGVNEFPGTGIGLATVQRIINRHGGRIWAESEVGKGAVFYFTLGSEKYER